MLRKIHPFILFLIAFGMIGLVLFLVQLPLMTMNTHFEGEWYSTTHSQDERISFPFVKRMEEPVTVNLSSKLPPTVNQSLLFPQIKATAIKATLDGATIFQIADASEPTGNFWANYVIIPLSDSNEENRILTLTVTGTQVITINDPPFIDNSRKINRMGSLHRFISNDLLLFFMGGSAVIGFLLIAISSHYSNIKISSRLIGIASILIVIWVLEFTYRSSTGPYLFYAFFKRFMLISGYLGLYLFSAGLDHYHSRKFTISRWTLIPTIGCIMAVMVVPNVGKLYQWLPYLNATLIINNVTLIVIIFRKLRNHSLLLLSGIIGTIAYIQITLVIIFQAPYPPVLQYFVVIMSILLSLQFLFEQKTIIQERDMFQEKMERDSLTGAFNRRVLNKIQADNYSVALFIDFDYFKYFNDKYGHDKGDELLAGFASKVKKHLRQNDLLIRFGGDEFLILLKSVKEKTALDIAERLRKELKKISGDSKVDMSYGLSIIEPGHPFKLDKIDKRMYEMKQSKKNKRV